MEIQGKLIQLLALVTGQGKNGEWRKQDIIIETQSQYPKKVALSIWGDKINASQLNVGAELKISFDIESREYNGRWYTELRAWKVESASAGNANNSAGTEIQNHPQEDAKDDLPF